MHEAAAHPRYAAQDKNADAQPPVRVLSKRSTCPVNAMPSVIKQQKNTNRPRQFARKLYAPNKNTCAMWMNTTATMKFDPHPCTARRNQPSGT